MCLRAFWFACVLVVCGVAPSFGQQRQTGPRTLEGLLNSEDAQKPAVAAAEADATDAGPKRPAGTVVRPKDGVQHPDLDKAWADYDAAVGKVTESIKAAINKQFDAATAKGDLDAAEKWQNALERFEKAGELPTDKDAKTAVSAAVADYKKAREELAAAYESVIKALTMEKKIAEAKAVRDESKLFSVVAGGAVVLEEAARAPRGAPNVAGQWNSNGSVFTITQRGDVLNWTSQDSRHAYASACKWNGTRFVGTCERTIKGSGCVVPLQLVLTVKAPNEIFCEDTVMQTGCGLTRNQQHTSTWKKVE